MNSGQAFKGTAKGIVCQGESAVALHAMARLRRYAAWGSKNMRFCETNPIYLGIIYLPQMIGFVYELC
jgi:hypothetical protein